MLPVWLIEAGVYGAEAYPLLAEIRRQGMVAEVIPFPVLLKEKSLNVGGRPLGEGDWWEKFMIPFSLLASRLAVVLIDGLLALPAAHEPLLPGPRPRPQLTPVFAQVRLSHLSWHRNSGTPR